MLVVYSKNRLIASEKFADSVYAGRHLADANQWRPLRENEAISPIT